MLTAWESRHLQFALPQSGKPDNPLRCGSDARNGRSMSNNDYTCLQYVDPYGKTLYQEYGQLMDELSHVSQGVYGYSDCAELFHITYG